MDSMCRRINTAGRCDQMTTADGGDQPRPRHDDASVHDDSGVGGSSVGGSVHHDSVHHDSVHGDSPDTDIPYDEPDGHPTPSRSASFWTGIGGALTGAAALVTALVGLITVFRSDEPAPPVADTTSITTTAAPTTTAPAFAVTSVSLVATPGSKGVLCGFGKSIVITFNAKITTNGAGTVKYRWKRSDGATGPGDEGTLVFDAAATKDLPPVMWTRGIIGGPKPVTGGYTLETLEPNSIQNTASYTFTCT